MGILKLKQKMQDKVMEKVNALGHSDAVLAEMKAGFDHFGFPEHDADSAKAFDGMDLMSSEAFAAMTGASEWCEVIPGMWYLGSWVKTGVEDPPVAPMGKGYICSLGDNLGVAAICA